MIWVTCVVCGTTLVAEDADGREAECPACHTKHHITARALDLYCRWQGAQGLERRHLRRAYARQVTGGRPKIPASR